MKVVKFSLEKSKFPRKMPKLKKLENDIIAFAYSSSLFFCTFHVDAILHESVQF